MNYANWRSRFQNSAYVTNGILAVTILVFILETLSGGSTNNAVLVTYGARANPLILYGQWWRLITPVFVHIGLTHILMNGFSLYFLGQMTERLFGHWRFSCCISLPDLPVMLRALRSVPIRWQLAPVQQFSAC